MIERTSPVGRIRGGCGSKWAICPTLPLFSLASSSSSSFLLVLRVLATSPSLLAFSISLPRMFFALCQRAGRVRFLMLLLFLSPSVLPLFNAALSAKRTFCFTNRFREVQLNLHAPTPSRRVWLLLHYFSSLSCFSQSRWPLPLWLKTPPRCQKLTRCGAAHEQEKIQHKQRQAQSAEGGTWRTRRRQTQQAPSARPKVAAREFPQRSPQPTGRNGRAPPSGGLWPVLSPQHRPVRPESAERCRRALEELIATLEASSSTSEDAPSTPQGDYVDSSSSDPWDHAASEWSRWEKCTAGLRSR